jgi:DNA modification methylase
VTTNADAISTARTAPIPTTLAQLAVPLDSVHPYPGNPRRGDVATIAASLAEHGQYRPLVVNERTREVLAGNHTWAAARELGWSEIAVTFVDVDDDEAKRIVLVDNRSSDLGDYDDGALAALLASLDFDYAGTGYDDDSAAKVLARIVTPGSDTDPGPLPEQATSRPGDLWALGEHRLLCGDATRAGDLELVLDAGERPACLWTDPPYGVDYVGKTGDALTMANDGAAGLPELLDAAFAAAAAVLAPGAAVYVCTPPGPDRLAVFVEAFRAQWRPRQSLVWAKDHMVLGHLDYHFQHELILFGYAPAPGRRGRGSKGWYGDQAQTSVFAVDRPLASREHPTMKPLALIEPMLVNSTRGGDLVLDPFAGAGSTLIACENLGRRARLVELDPRYCDVIVDRFERHTGLQPRLVEQEVAVGAGV